MFCCSLQEDYDLDIAWMRGLSIISSQPMIPRTVCYLCASTGKHEVSVQRLLISPDIVFQILQVS